MTEVQHKIHTIAESSEVAIIQHGIMNSEFIVEDNATLDLYIIHDAAFEEEEAQLNEMKKTIHLGNSSIVRVFSALFDSVDIEITGIIDGERSTYEHHALYFGDDSMKMNMKYDSLHTGAGSQSRTIVRGVATAQSAVDFKGNIVIEQGGKKTDSHLEHEGLLLSKKANINALPGFDVHTDDVKAVHSSAVHYVRPEQLFYLQSRGIEEGVAREMIIKGFLHEQLALVTDDEVLSTIEAYLDQKCAAL